MSSGSLSVAQKRDIVVASLKRFDQLAAMSSRGDPDGCRLALAELAALEEQGLAFELGPHAHTRAMDIAVGDADMEPI